MTDELIRPVDDHLRGIDAAQRHSLTVLPLAPGIGRIAERIFPTELVPVVYVERQRIHT